MQCVYTPTAEKQIESQLDYSIARFGSTVAARTGLRIRSYVRDVLARHPRIGSKLPSIDAFEAWIPRTPFVIIYRVEEQAGILRVLAVFHHAQDRESFDPADA